MSWDLAKMAAGLPSAWVGFLIDWHRSLRSGNYPSTTRYNDVLAVIQLARYLIEPAGQPDAGDGTLTPIAVTRADIEDLQAWKAIATATTGQNPAGPRAYTPAGSAPAKIGIAGQTAISSMHTRLDA